MSDHFIHVECPVEECGTEMKIALEYEAGESNWGADADGRRGMYVPGRWYVAGDLPMSCPNHHTFTDAEIAQIDKQATAEADEYSYDFESDYEWAREHDDE